MMGGRRRLMLSMKRRAGGAGGRSSAGLVLAWAIWTEGVAMAPFTAFWLWTGVMSFLLLRGRFGAEGPAQ